MADPLSLAASVVGITVPALHATRLLLNDLQEFKDAPNTVQRLQEDLRAVGATITSLQAIEDREWTILGTEIAEDSKTTISTCKKACDSFRADIGRWTRHSADGKLSWQDRIDVGFIKQSRIKSITGQLQNCKMTINSVVSIATLYASIRNGRVTEETRIAISMQQTEVTDAIGETENRLQAVENSMKNMDLQPDKPDQAEYTNNMAEVLQRLEEEQRAFATSLKLLQELSAKSQAETVAEAAPPSQGSITGPVTFGSQNSGFQAGVINGGVSGITFGKQ